MRQGKSHYDKEEYPLTVEEALYKPVYCSISDFDKSCDNIIWTDPIPKQTDYPLQIETDKSAAPKFIVETVQDSTIEVKLKVRDFELSPTVKSYRAIIEAIIRKSDRVFSPINTYLVYNYYIPKAFERELKSDVGSKKLFDINMYVQAFAGMHGIIYSDNDTHYLVRVCVINNSSVKEFIQDLDYNLKLLKGDNYFIDLSDVESNNIDQEFCAILTIGLEKN